MSAPAASVEEQLTRELHEIPEEHWPDLLQLVRKFREHLTLKPLEANLRQSLREVRLGQTTPVPELWNGIGAD